MGLWKWIQGVWNKAWSGLKKMSKWVKEKLLKVWEAVKWPFIQLGKGIAWCYSKLPKGLRNFLNAIGARIAGFAKAVWNHAESLLLLLAAGVGLTAILAEIPGMMILPIWLETKLVVSAVAAAIILGLTSIMKLRSNTRKAEAVKELQAKIRRKLNSAKAKVQAAVRAHHAAKASRSTAVAARQVVAA